MKASYDIHIHSILSPCGDDLQTPNNILNMCMLKELNIVSITDHNSLKHLRIFDELRKSFEFLFLYGVEVEVKEGFHVLAYFENLNKALEFDKILENHLDKEEYDSEYLGKQIICDIYDMEEQVIPYYLNKPLNLSYDEFSKYVRSLDGIIILAHIDKSSKGALKANIDLSKSDFDAIEVTGNEEDIYNKYPFLKKYKVFRNSDAHTLMLINESINYIEIESLDFNSFKKALVNKNE